MKYLSYLSLTIFAVFLCLNSAVAEGRPYIKLGGAVTNLSDTDFESFNGDTFITGDTSQDTGYAFTVAAGYRVSPKFGFELEVARRQNDFDSVEVDGADVLSAGSLDATSVMVNGYYYFSYYDLVTPYVGFGIGALVDSEYDVIIDGFGGSRSNSEGAFAFQGMVGFEIPVSESFRFYTEGRIFSASSPDVDNEVSTFNFNYDNYSIGAGVSYLF